MRRSVGWDRRDAPKELSSVSLSFGRGDLVSALNKAYAKLKDLKMEKEILIISDMTRGDWERFNPSKLSLSPSGSLPLFLRIGGEKRDPILESRGWNSSKAMEWWAFLAG